MTGSPQTLVDRAAISDVVIAYATAVDRRDWELFRSLFTARVLIDMRSLDPSRHREVSVEELVRLASPLGNFSATQHVSTNHVHRIEGDTATCVSYMQAGHFLTRPDGEFFCFLYGHYTYSLIRTQHAWKISGYALNVTARHGDARVFEWAGLLPATASTADPG